MEKLNKKRLSKMIILALVIFICMMMYFTVWYMRRYFPNWHMRTVLYAFNGPYHHMFIKKYLKQVLISALGMAFLVVVSLYFIERDFFSFFLFSLLLLIVLSSFSLFFSSSIFLFFNFFSL